jgi:putative endonuclease
MFYVYILKSVVDEKLYIGYTSNLKKRIVEHNSGKVKSTTPRLPVYLIYYEAYNAKVDATERERKLKRYSGSLTHLKKRIKFSMT